MQDLLQNTKLTHSDYEDLRISLWKMKRVADYINEKKRDADNIHEVLTVQDKLTGKFDVRFFVLFCFVLFCFVLFCFVLFCFVLFCFVLFCFVLFCFVLFCFVL